MCDGGRPQQGNQDHVSHNRKDGERKQNNEQTKGNHPGGHEEMDEDPTQANKGRKDKYNRIVHKFQICRKSKEIRNKNKILKKFLGIIVNVSIESILKTEIYTHNILQGRIFRQ